MSLVRNLTPFDLVMSMQKHAAPVYEAAAFATVAVPAAPGEQIYVQRRGDDLQWALGAVPVSGPDQTVSVTVDDLRSNFGSDRAFSRTRTFVNRTNEWVDVSSGAEKPYKVGTLGPNERCINDFPNAELWIVRSAFSNEVVSVFIDDDDRAHRDVTYEITDDYRGLLAEHAPLPSPLPGNRPVVLISGKREIRRPEDRIYITTEDRDGPVRAEFNGRANVVPRRVKVAGAKLIWDSNDDKFGLMSLQGDKVLDLESLEMVADEVVIRSHLRMPGTNVSIRARRVEFAYDGMVDTSPPIVPPPAFPGPKEKGPKAYTAQKGTDGLPGGSVTLITNTLITGDTAKIRIRTRGGPGGAAERGGLLGYIQRPTHAPNTVAPESSADRTVIQKSDIARKLPAWFGTITTAKDLDGWLWPGRHTDPSNCQFEGQPLGLGESANPRVTSLVIAAHDDRWLSQDTNWFEFPDGDRWHENLVYTTRRYAQYRTPKPRPVPGKGADAYPGGRPGDGGDAGLVVTNPEHAARVAQISDTHGGDAGPPTAAFDGAPPGKPPVALLVDMTIARNDSSARDPQMWVEKYSAQPGEPAEGKTANPGRDGEVKGGGGSWLTVEAVDAMLAFARAAFRDGHRAEARRAIEPYYAIFRSPLLARRQEFSAQTIALSTMRDNLMANLDYYGNPPGWLPRLRVSTNLALFDTVRRASYQLLYFAATTERKFDDIEHRGTLAGEVRAALESESTACLKAVAEATDLMATARLELSKLANDLGAQQQALDKLKNYAEQEALSAEEKKRLLKGVMQVVGGAMQAIPVGQPYLGAGGDLVSAIGEVDFFTSDKAGDQAAQVLAKIGSATDSFLEDNTDLIASDLTKKLRRDVKLGNKEVKSLSDQVTQANGEAGQIEENVAEYTKPIESQRLADLQARRDKLAVTREKIEEAIEEFKSGEKPEDVVVEPVASPKSPKEASLDRDLLNLTKSLDEVDGKLAAVTAEDKAKDAKRLVRLRLQKVALTDAKLRAEALQKNKEEAEGKVEAAEEKSAAKQERYAEAMGRLKTMGKGISGIGAGIGTLATPVAKDDAAVQSLAADLLKTKDPQQYQRVMKEMIELGKRQKAAMEKLLKAQSIINGNVARMAESLTAQNNLGRQLHTMDNALDVRAKQYLRGMRQRAEEMFHSSMYHLVMSYRYEALEDLPDSFVNYDRITGALLKLDSAAPTVDTAKSGKPSELSDEVQKLNVDMTDPTEEDLQRIDELVLNFEFLKLGVEIANKRQHRATEKKLNTATLALRQDQLQQLSQLGTITFNLVEDFGQGGRYTWRGRADRGHHAHRGPHQIP